MMYSKKKIMSWVSSTSTSRFLVISSWIEHF